MTGPLVTVVTVTRARPEGLLRAMRSVAAQEGVRTRHVVVGDDCPALADPVFAARLRRDFPEAIVDNRPRTTEEEYVFARIGRLRNHGIALSEGEFVAQLDDDNRLEPNHLGSLVDTLERTPTAGVAHSWRRLVLADGTDFAPPGLDPWHPFPDEQAASYRRLVAMGVFSPGSPVVRDLFRHDGALIARVDTSEFLVRREVHRDIGFPTAFPPGQQRRQWSEDFVFAVQLDRAGIEVACSRLPTLVYTMGGLSNHVGTRKRNVASDVQG
jgi:GT2 family glycosyltransferase